ncbi:acyl-CoA thioesterase [Herbihabitans rhizosphaerae]|uniref:acyl-CoA thioesterase n=1 Tax=Herbihabitans rhizosphaerae TaxID=1872711 RepID=UPI001A928604|nr:acyl-CoA thioesterase [Herbihabitans rhizosphaerae]
MFTIRLTVRAYELDAQGIVNGAVYLQYGEHARWECLRAAGITADSLRAKGVTPIRIEETVRYHEQLRAGDEITVSCAFTWGDGKAFRVHQDVRRPDGTLVAEVANVGGVLDVEAGRLVRDPAERFRAVATDPALLGLAG